MAATEEQVTLMMNQFQEAMGEMKKMRDEMLTILKGKTEKEGESSATNKMTFDSNNFEEERDRSMMSRSRTFKPKPKRLEIDAEIDDLEWQIFEDSWDRYKRIAELTDRDEVCLELRECCSSDVNKLLYEYKGKDALNDQRLSEQQLLEFIKSVAVKTIHVEIHRKHFDQKAQEAGEPVTKYVGRLKAQAALCDFTVQCHCTRSVSYAEAMISQKLVAGLSNSEHQAKVLSEAKDLPNLNSKVERLVSLETSEDATSEIRSSHTQQTPVKVAAARFSQYKKQKRSPTPERHQSWKKPTSSQKSWKKPISNQSRDDQSKRRRLRCRGFDQSNHGENKTMNREN